MRTSDEKKGRKSKPTAKPKSVGQKIKKGKTELSDEELNKVSGGSDKSSAFVVDRS